MHRFLTLVALLLLLGLGRFSALAQGAAGLPARPTPFQFVNDQASVLAPADAKKLESGLRQYADKTGTQVVVVIVPTLGGRTAADYGRALGTAWGVGQRDKNNGLVVLVAPQEHKIAIEPGSGLKDKITPAVTQRVISQDFGPNFKQGNYFAGLRKGLSALMLAANPASDPSKNAARMAGAAASANSASSSEAALNQDAGAPAAMPAPEPMSSPQPAPVAAPESSGPGMGTLLLGALGIGVVLFFLVRMFRRSSTATNQAGGAPVFNPNQPNQPMQPNRPGGTPNFLPGSSQPQGNNNGPGLMGGGNSGGSGIGGMLATGAAAAAGAYLGNRMAGGGHDTAGNNLAGQQTAGLGGFGSGAAGGAGMAPGAAPVDGSDYFSNRDGGGAADNQAPDYFSNENTAPDAGSGDYFSSDDNSGSSSYDDTSSADTGGGGFDGGGGDDNSGSF